MSNFNNLNSCLGFCVRGFLHKYLQVILWYTCYGLRYVYPLSSSMKCLKLGKCSFRQAVTFLNPCTRRQVSK